MGGSNSKVDEDDRQSEIQFSNQGLSSLLPAKSRGYVSNPETSFDSRKVVLRSERKDTIGITEVVERFRDQDVPESLIVLERIDTYYGPELTLFAEGRNYMLTAPGPDTQLLLWAADVDDSNYREVWVRLAEVEAEICRAPQYELCEQCGSPVRSKEHARLSAIGRCPKSR